MLLTIHNLPATTRYADIKSLLQSKCGLQQVILDNLVGEGVGKKVTVGVAEDADAAILVRKINGIYWNGQQLYVEDVRQQKNASEQPYRSTAPPTQDTDQSFSLNLQQHTSYPQTMMPTAPAVQPMMSMYYDPDYTNYEYPNATGMQPNFMQNQYDQAQNVQNAYMGIGDVQTSQMPQAGAQYNQDFSGSDQNQSSWASYNNEEDFVGKMPHYGHNSPGRKREVDWIPNRRESPPRVERGQPWAGRGPRPTKPDFRPNRPDERSGFKELRPDFRPNNRQSLLPLPAHEFSVNDQGRSNQFSGSRELPNKRQDRPDQRERFADRSNEFGQNARRGPKEFSGRPNERRGNNEFAGRQNEFSGRPNEFSGRPNERRGPNDFAGGMNERGRPDELYERPNERRGPNQFSERPTERRGLNEFSGRPNERQRRPNEHQVKPNDFSGRKERPNDRPYLSKSNREYGQSNERDEFSRPTDRAEFSRRDRPERNSRPNPDTRKRRFDERFNEVERPERVSRPKPSRPSNFDIKYGAFQPTRRSFLNAINRIIYVMKMNLEIPEMDVATRLTLKKLINGRLRGAIDGKKIANPHSYYEFYRSMYPEMDDKSTYDAVLAMVSETPQVGTAESEQPKPEEEAKPLLPRMMTRSERELIRKQKEAQTLLAQGKLPSFPEGDKRKVAQQRKEEKEGHIPEVDAPYKIAMEEEINKVTDLFINELDNAPTPAQQRAYNTVDRAHLIEEMKQYLRKNLARRISNTGLKVVRIYGSPKLPTRAVLENALFKLGVQCLRKSTKTKMYTAALDSYETLDKLCTMEALPVAGDITITFKPFHMALKEKADQKILKIMRKKKIDDMIDKTELNLLDKDWPAREAEIKAAQEIEAEAAKEAKEAEAAKDTKADLEDEAKSQDGEKVELNNTVPKDDLTTSDPKNDTSDALNDFQVIDEVNEDSDVEFTSAVVEENDLNSENKGDGEDNNGYGDENIDDVGNNVNDECSELDDTRDEDDNEFDVDNVDVDINDIDEDDLEDY